jgi:adenine-specific DNA-methyltransferase
MKLYRILEQQLKKEPNFVTDNGELKKWVALNKAQNFDEELIGLLLDNAELKEKFFVNVKGTLVFNQNLFVQFLEQKNFLNDSYTQYKNKVGLTIGGKYLKQRNEVALVWPFKDCILEGGQSREEDKREEIFFNEILAQDEITQLLEPKVLTNAKRINKDGEKPLDQFNRNEQGTITDNLIIKGNNLLALHTLKQEFAGKVKLIYIDPPYNTGKDGFQYNDKFSVSAWLTFMKNRLTVSYTLLSNDGVIFIQIDDKYKDYLKLCCDEIFKPENFLANIIWKKRGGAPNDKIIGATHENILLYSKTDGYKLYKKPRNDSQKARYFNPDNHPKGDWAPDNLMANVKGGRYVASLNFGIINPNTGEEHFPSSNGNWRYNRETIIRLLENDEIYFGLDGKGKPKLKRFFCDLKDEGVSTGTVWDDLPHNNTATNEILNLFGSVNEFDTPKPEGLIERIINIGSSENDIVLDFFAGSGTTAAVAMKMGRQFITTEQMGYIETVTIARLKKVIEGEQGGISKSVNWQGGGSFVYLELKKYNQTFIEQIEEAKDTKALLEIWEQMKAKSFLNYNVDIKKQDEHLEEFKALSLAEQKQHLCELLDKNQLYVNLSSLNDTDFACTDDEKKVTQDFYQIKK